MVEASPTTKDARRCTNPDCEYGGRWVVGKMRLLRSGKFSCLGKGCQTIYEARDVIDSANQDYRLYVQGQARGATVDRLLSYLLSGALPGAADEVAADLAEWLSASARFVSFAHAHRDKIRKKLRGASDSQARGDVLAELEVVFWLLVDRRLEVAFEAYGVSRRGPDFTVTFRAVHRFNLEVTRPRLDEDDRPGRDRAEGLASAMLGKLRQLPANAPNAVLVAIDGPLPSQDEVVVAMRSLRQRANRRDDIFFQRRGFADARDFHLHYRRLSALFVASRGGAGARAWSNAEARHQLPDGALTACLGCLGGPAVRPS